MLEAERIMILPVARANAFPWFTARITMEENSTAGKALTMPVK